MALWDDRDFPILQAFAKVEGRQQVSSTSIASEVGREENTYGSGSSHYKTRDI